MSKHHFDITHDPNIRVELLAQDQGKKEAEKLVECVLGLCHDDFSLEALWLPRVTLQHKQIISKLHLAHTTVEYLKGFRAFLLINLLPPP